MSSLDVSRLSPGDAVAALRSFPRRFRAAALPLPDDPAVEEWAERVGPEGSSTVELVWQAANTFVLLQQALRQVIAQDRPTLHPAVIDESQRSWELPAHTTIFGALERLDEAASALADEVSRVPSDDWMRTATIAGGGEVTAIDLVREAVRSGADTLRRVEATMRAVR